MMSRRFSYHVPVLLKESVAGLNIKPGGTYIDATYGGGGHSEEILKHLNENGKLYAFDQDEEAIINRIDDERLELIEGNFANIKQYLRSYAVTKVDGILADLGVSSYQIDKPERGFSIRYDERLDMRMDKNADLSAYDVLNQYDDRDLRMIFSQYGNLKNANALAKSIVRYRAEKKIETTGELIEIVSRHFPRFRQNKFLAKLFQAIRIEVNEEIKALKKLLEQSANLLKPGGRLSVISYHSLEDRLVKRYMRDGVFEGEFEKDLYGNAKVPFKRVEKLIVPDEKEIEKNSRARSARLRIAEKI